MPFLDLGSRRIEYSVVRGTSRRYTYFRFRHDLTLEVILPRGPSVDVGRVMRERAPWLEREYARISRTRRVLDRDMVMLDGEVLRAVFIDSREEKLVPDSSTGVVNVFTGEGRRWRELVRRWFLGASSSYAVRRAAELAPRVGARPARVDVREIARWGYCTRTGRLSFSWQLIALPERLREYVVLHELVHLLEFNHSAAFRKRLAAVCPDFRERERELDLVAPYDRLAPP